VAQLLLGQNFAPEIVKMILARLAKFENVQFYAQFLRSIPKCNRPFFTVNGLDIMSEGQVVCDALASGWRSAALIQHKNLNQQECHNRCSP
jgi:hypothetical protein